MIDRRKLRRRFNFRKTVNFFQKWSVKIYQILVRREQVQNRKPTQKEMPSLKELLEGLTESQRNAARCYLSILASAEGGGLDG